jgi:enamine deaminase RidA (YjgF/YER057c/UK114 family)
MKEAMRILQPEGWAAPKGYVNGIAARGTLVFVSGQIGWNVHQRFETDDFVGQARQALANVIAILHEGGAGPEHITRMTWYVVDKHEYVGNMRALGAAYREIVGRHFPAMTAVAVAGLIEDRAKLEIEVTAVVPDRPGEA